MKLCDKVIIGADENRKYLDFWPHVAYAYRTIFPGVEVVLALVTDRKTIGDPLIRELERHGTVTCVPKVEGGFPLASQAKMARFLVAGWSGNSVCYIDDLDEIPIDRDWHLQKVDQRRVGAMLLIGREVYAKEYPGQVPASMMCAEGHVFGKLFALKPTTEYDDWYKYLFAMRASDIDHTNIKLATFSDEALITRLRQANPIDETHVIRGYVTGLDTIDRGYWPYSLERLQAGKYVTAHTARPYREYKQGNDAIVKYIKERYDGGPLPEPLSQ